MTHETKVQDIAKSLRKAITAFEVAPDPEPESKSKGVHHLADRLLMARLKAVQARLSAFREPGSKMARVSQLRKLQTRERELEAQGGAGILKEFRFPGSVF